MQNVYWTQGARSQYLVCEAIVDRRPMTRSYLMRGMIALLVLGLILAACVSTKSTFLNPGHEQYAPLPPDSVRIFTADSELDSLQYVRVAMIEATGSGEWTSQTGMYSAMRKKAAELGCNGVILPQINEPGAGAKVAGAIFGTGTQRKGNAVAIRVLGKKIKSTSE
jgi:hypothetical protein